MGQSGDGEAAPGGRGEEQALVRVLAPAKLGVPRRRPHQPAEQPRPPRSQRALVPCRIGALRPIDRRPRESRPAPGQPDPMIRPSFLPSSRGPSRMARGVCAAALLCVALGSAGRAWGADEDDPAAEQASFQVADGFEVHLFASEKDGVVKPIQIRFDARGRLWVIGSTVYPQIQPGETPDDKVLILEDRDGDGRCDKTTVFARGLMIPTGLELGDGGAYIGHGTELLFLKDTDGDGQADERRVLLRGFGTGDNHQNINSFRWSPGGELWMCQGLHTFSNVETPWGLVRLAQAGLWRLRPRLLRLEGFYGTAHEPQ